MNLWLDDLRPAPEGWAHAHNVEEAKHYLETGLVEKCSLDHDLGDGPLCSTCLWSSKCEMDPDECRCKCHGPGLTGYDLLKWIQEKDLWPKEKPHVHSANPVGSQNMRNFINDFGPY